MFKSFLDRMDRVISEHTSALDQVRSRAQRHELERIGTSAMRVTRPDGGLGQSRVSAGAGVARRRGINPRTGEQYTADDELARSALAEQQRQRAAQTAPTPLQYEGQILGPISPEHERLIGIDPGVPHGVEPAFPGYERGQEIAGAVGSLIARSLAGPRLPGTTAPAGPAPAEGKAASVGRAIGEEAFRGIVPANPAELAAALATGGILGETTVAGAALRAEARKVGVAVETYAQSPAARRFLATLASERGALEGADKAKAAALRKAIAQGEAEFDNAVGAQRRAALLEQIEKNRGELARLENAPLPGQVDMFGNVAPERAPAPEPEGVQPRLEDVPAEAPAPRVEEVELTPQQATALGNLSAREPDMPSAHYDTVRGAWLSTAEGREIADRAIAERFGGDAAAPAARPYTVERNARNAFEIHRDGQPTGETFGDRVTAIRRAHALNEQVDHGAGGTAQPTPPPDVSQPPAPVESVTPEERLAQIDAEQDRIYATGDYGERELTPELDARWQELQREKLELEMAQRRAQYPAQRAKMQPVLEAIQARLDAGEDVIVPSYTKATVLRKDYTVLSMDERGTIRYSVHGRPRVALTSDAAFHMAKLEQFPAGAVEDVAPAPVEPDFQGANWNEEAFILNGDFNYEAVEGDIHAGPFKRSGTPSGDPVMARNVYRIGRDRENPDRLLLLARTEDDAGRELVAEGPVGELVVSDDALTGGSRMGIMEAYRNEGAGTRFLQEAERIYGDRIGASATPRGFFNTTYQRNRARAAVDETVSPPGEPAVERAASVPSPAPSGPPAPTGELERVVVDIDDLDFRPELFQARDVAEGQPFNPAQVEKLRRLKERGTQIGPPTVVRNPDKPGRYIVFVGHNRTQLAREAGEQRITVKIDPADINNPDDLARVQQSAITSNYKTGTSFSEDARAFTRLEEQGADAVEIRDVTKAKSVQTVEDVLDAARLGPQAIERMNLDKSAQGVGAEIGRGVRVYGITREDANAMFNRFMNPDEGGKVPSRTAVRSAVDLVGREMKRPGAVQFEGFAGLDAEGGGAMALLNDYTRTRGELETELRRSRTLENALNRVRNDAKSTPAERKNATASAKDAAARVRRLQDELKRLETGVRDEIAPERVVKRSDAKIKRNINATIKARAAGERGNVELMSMTDEALEAAAAGDEGALATARGLLGESQLEGRVTRFDTPELVAAREKQSAVREAQVLRDKKTGEILNDTPARQAERQRIIDEELARTEQPVGGQDVTIAQGNDAFIVLGPPAAGKSRVVVDPIIRRTGARLIDSDEYKGPLAAFEGLTEGVKGGGDGYGGAVHDASDLVWEGVLEGAIAKGDNLALPLVGKNPARIDELGRRLADAGYTVHLMIVELPDEKAAGRALTRFYGDERLVDPEYVLTIDGRPRSTFDTLKSREWVTDYERWDNDVEFGQPPRLIEKSDPSVDAGGDRGPGEVPRGSARGEARQGGATGGGAVGGSGPESRAPEPVQQPAPPEPEPHGTSVEAARVDDPLEWGDGAIRLLTGADEAQAPAAAAGGTQPPQPPKPPIAQAHSAGGGTSPEGILAELLERPPEEGVARALWRKYTGMRTQEAVELRGWYEDMQDVARRSGMPRGKEATPEKRAFIMALHGEGSPDAFPQEWRGLFDALQARKKVHEERLLAADPSFERKLLPEYWPRQFVQERDRLGARLKGLIPGKLRPGKTPHFGIRRKYGSLAEALDAGEELVTYDPIDQWARREVEGIEYIYTHLVVQAYKASGRALPASQAPADWLTPPYKAFEPKPYPTKAKAVEFINDRNPPEASLEGYEDALAEEIDHAVEMYDDVKKAPLEVRRRIGELRRIIRTGIEEDAQVRYTQPLRVAPEDYRVLIKQFGLPLRELEMSDVLANIAGVSKRLKVTGGLFQHVDLSLRTLARATQQALEGLATRNPEQLAGAGELATAIPRAWWRATFPAARRAGNRRSAESRVLQMLREEGLQEAGGIDIMKRTVADAIGEPNQWGLGQLPAGVKGAAAVNRASDALNFFNSGLYDALHPELMGAMGENIFAEIRRAHPELSARQAAARAAETTNIVMSAIPEWQSLLSPRIRQFGRGIFFSPNETEAWFRQVSGAIAGPNARTFQRQWVGYAIMTLTLAETINLAFTGELMDLTQYSPIEVRDEGGLAGLGSGPSVTFNPRFMRPRLTGDGPAGKLGLFRGSGGRDLFLDLLGQSDTPFRWLLAPTFALKSRLSSPINIAWGLADSKHQFTGEPIESLQDRARFAAEEFALPIGVTGYTGELDRIGLFGSLFQSGGFNVSAERNADLRNRTAESELGRPYDALSDQEKLDYRERHPDHFAAADELTEGTDIRRSVELSEDRRRRMTELGEDVTANGTYETYANRRGDILQDIAARRDELPDDFPEGTTLEDRAQSIYYEAIDAAREASPTGLIDDFGQVDDDAREAVRAALGDEGEAALDESMIASADPVEREFLRARQTISQSGYWDVGREIWGELQDEGDAPLGFQSVAELEAFETQAALDEILREEPDADYIRARAAAERLFKREYGSLVQSYNRITKRLRERIRASDPAVAEGLVKWFGLSARGVEDLREAS